MKNIIEGNKLIAEFMGLSYCTKHLYEGWYKNHEHNHRLCDFNGLKYHSSWDWLMPIIEKIERIDFVVIIKQSECVIVNNSGNNPKFIQEVTLTKIEATWFAVVEFIKWYNKKKVTLK